MKTRNIRAVAHMDRALVLLSGGMDSVAALHWAHEHADKVRAVGFAYGQPNRDHETYAAQVIARDLGVEYRLLHTANALHVGVGLVRDKGCDSKGPLQLDHEPTLSEGGRGGLSKAFIPGRNAVLLSLAAAQACTWFPSGTIDLVIGACADDAAGFPDCRAPFFAAAERMLCIGYGREFRVRTPYVLSTKRSIISESSEAARRDIARSWSCYRAEGPCGTCTPCLLRRDAFAAHGIEDQCARAVLGGGDKTRSW